MVEEKSRTKHHWVYNWKGEEPLWTLILLRLSLEECWPNQFQERSPLKGCRRHLIGFKRDVRPITSCHSVSGRSFRCPEIQRSCLGDHSCRERPRLRARFVKKHFSIGKCQDNISDDFWSILRSDTMVIWWFPPKQCRVDGYVMLKCYISVRGRKMTAVAIKWWFWRLSLRLCLFSVHCSAFTAQRSLLTVLLCPD